MNGELRSRPVRILAVVLVLLVALEATVAPYPAPKFPWHHIPGYAATIGLGGGLLLIWLAAALGRAVLQRPERDDD